MAASERIDAIQARLDGAVEMRSLRESMRELSETTRPPREEALGSEEDASGAPRSAAEPNPPG